MFIVRAGGEDQSQSLKLRLRPVELNPGALTSLGRCERWS